MSRRPAQDSAPRICDVDGCTRPVSARNLCSKLANEYVQPTLRDRAG